MLGEEAVGKAEPVARPQRIKYDGAMYDGKVKGLCMRMKKGILLPIVLLGLSGRGGWCDSQGMKGTPTGPRHRRER